MLNLKPVGFARSEDGVAATEFAIIAPILIAMLLGTIEFSKYNLVNRRANLATQMMAEYLSRDKDNILNFEERTQVNDIWVITNPSDDSNEFVGQDKENQFYSLGFGSVEFELVDPGCVNIGSNCEYNPKVDRTYQRSKSVSNPVYTHCDLDVVENDVKPDGTRIPRGITGRSAIISTDVVFPYNPLLSNSYLPSFEIHVNALRKTRSGERLIIAESVVDVFLGRVTIC